MLAATPLCTNSGVETVFVLGQQYLGQCDKSKTLPSFLVLISSLGQGQTRQVQRPNYRPGTYTTGTETRLQTYTPGTETRLQAQDIHARYTTSTETRLQARDQHDRYRDQTKRPIHTRQLLRPDSRPGTYTPGTETRLQTYTIGTETRLQARKIHARYSCDQATGPVHRQQVQRLDYRPGTYTTGT
jgi:hypothetical protein